MTARDALCGRRLVFLDSAPVIYLIERNPTYVGLARSLFEVMARNEAVMVTSPITLAECLVGPLRRGHFAQRDLFIDVITAGAAVRFVHLDEAITERAAELRAHHNLSLQDAFQAAVALEVGCDGFLTNDQHFTRVKGLDVLKLDDLEP